MLEVVVKKAHRYGNVRREVGDRYLAEEKMVPALTHLGWIEPGARKPRGKRKINGAKR